MPVTAQQGRNLAAILENRSTGKELQIRSRNLAHDADGVAFRVIEKGHPEVMVGHLRDEMRGVNENGAALLQRDERPLNVIDLEIQDGTAPRTWLIGRGKHEPDVATLEEGKMTSVEEEFHAQSVLVEIPCA